MFGDRPMVGKSKQTAKLSSSVRIESTTSFLNVNSVYLFLTISLEDKMLKIYSHLIYRVKLLLIDIQLLENKSVQAESLLHRLMEAVRGIVLFVNWDKTEFVSFNQGATLSLLYGKPLKLVNQLIYFGSNISSSERDVNIRIG